MYMYNLTKVNTGFEEVKNLRLQIEGDFTVIQNKLDSLREIYTTVVSKHKKIECTLGVDALFFQRELINKEFGNMKGLFVFIVNRIYCEYYKLYYYVKDYIETTLCDDIVHSCNMNEDVPPYKSLDTSIEYEFADIIKLQSSIVQTIEKMKIFCSKNELLNNKEKNMLKMGLHIDTVIHTQNYTNIVMHEKLKMFYNYLETFNRHHAKHLGRLLKKTKMIVSIISDDMPLDDSGQSDDANASNPDDAPASNPDDANASNPDDTNASNPDDANASESNDYSPESNDDDANASNDDDATASNPDDATASNPDDATASNPDDANASNPDDAPASNDDANASNDDATDKVGGGEPDAENIENDETEIDSLNSNKLDNSGDVAKFVKSVVAADNISFTTKT